MSSVTSRHFDSCTSQLPGERRDDHISIIMENTADKSETTKHLCAFIFPVMLLTDMGASMQIIQHDFFLNDAFWYLCNILTQNLPDGPQSRYSKFCFSVC